MKIKLTPQLAYLIGLWKYRRSEEGLGTRANEQICEVFASELVKCGIARPEEIKTLEGKTFTYHSAYRAFFDEVLRRQDDAFRHRNEYAAQFYAGLFDAMGGEKEGRVYFAKADNADEICLMRQDWKVVRTGKMVWVGPAEEFKAWIKPYRKVEIPEKPPAPSARAVTRKIERRPRRVYPLPPT